MLTPVNNTHADPDPSPDTPSNPAVEPNSTTLCPSTPSFNTRVITNTQSNLVTPLFPTSSYSPTVTNNTETTKDDDFLGSAPPLGTFKRKYAREEEGGAEENLKGKIRKV